MPPQVSGGGKPHPLQVECVHNDRLNYELTTRHRAENLDRNREEIEQRWGRAHFRRFQLYLWGCVDGFASSNDVHLGCR